MKKESMHTRPIIPALTSRLDARLAAYAAVAAAGVAVTAPSSEATIISSGPVNITIPSNTNGIYLNVVTGTTGTTSATTPGWDINPFSTSSLSLFTSTGTGGNGAALGTPAVGAYVGTGTTYFNLSVGTVISSASTFANTGTSTIATTTPLNFNSSINYIGFRLFNEATSTVDYGYFQVSLSATAQAQPRSIVSYAYENSGGAITVVPEPGSVALLGAMAAGAVGVRAWKRRKAAQGRSAPAESIEG